MAAALAREGEVLNVCQSVHIDVRRNLLPFDLLYLWVARIAIAAFDAKVSRSLAAPFALTIPVL